jgi:predicted alpha/beta-hydrolase family hydrolase
MSDRLWLTDGPQNAECTLILAHGAGAGMDTEFMTTFAESLAAEGIRVLRFEFGYMAKKREDGRRRGPSGSKKLLLEWKEALEEADVSGRVVIGGKSMGGRLASMLAAEEPALVAGLVCLGYPFHPPGKPEKLRTEHLAELGTPTLIVQGDRDPFGTREEVEGYTLSDSIALHWLGDGEHSFKPRKKSGRTLEQNWQEGVEAIRTFLQTLA